MKYKRIKFEMFDYEKDFYRDFLIRENVNLLELAIIFADSVYGSLDHLFCLKDNNRTYVTEREDVYSPNVLYMSDHHLSDLDSDFLFIYDYGEDWTFKCSVENKSYNKPGNEFVYLLDGKGLGIFEDNKDLFMKYMKNGLDDSDVEEIWNLPIMEAGEIDEYDVEMEDYRIRKDAPFSIYEFIEECQEEGLETNIENIDLTEYKTEQEIDDYFGDEYDEDFDDEDFDDFDIVQMAFLESANYLIENTKFGKEEYNRLLKKHEDLEIRAIFMKELLSLVRDALYGENNEFNNKLVDALRKIK